MISLSSLNYLVTHVYVYRLVFWVFWNFNPDINYSHIGIQVIGIKDHKFKQLQKGVDLSFYEVLIHKHTVRKDKGTKDMEKK